MESACLHSAANRTNLQQIGLRQIGKHEPVVVQTHYRRFAVYGRCSLRELFTVDVRSANSLPYHLAFSRVIAKCRQFQAQMPAENPSLHAPIFPLPLSSSSFLTTSVDIRDLEVSSTAAFFQAGVALTWLRLPMPVDAHSLREIACWPLHDVPESPPWAV